MATTYGAPTRVRATRDAESGGAETPRRRPTREGPLRRLVLLGGAAALILAAIMGYALTRDQSWERSGPPATVSAWAPYWQTDSALASFTANRAVFSDLSLFAFHATAADSVTA